MNLLLAQANQGGSGNGMVVLVVYVIIIGLFFYFTMIRPQKNERNRMNAMISSLEVGDIVLTTSGFYGVIIDIEEETVIVEFGSNKNCRIPMQKTAISQVEKPEK